MDCSIGMPFSLSNIKTDIQFLFVNSNIESYAIHRRVNFKGSKVETQFLQDSQSV